MKKQPSSAASHPAQRFAAPGTIETGVPLKELMGKHSIDLLAESMAAVFSGFDFKSFRRGALRGLPELELTPRGAHIGRVLLNHLPKELDKVLKILLASFGPELSKTEGNGLAPFFYLPHANLIATALLGHFEHGMKANYELTKRFSAEFSIRPFLVEHQDKCMQRLSDWTSDPNPHVRRLVSEGTRPRLPWAMRLRAFQQDPRFTLPLLEKLKDDPELYVRRSVANHLADILKDHPDAAYAVCERWIEEANSNEKRLWMIRHTVRLPAKKGDARALKIRLQATSGH